MSPKTKTPAGAGERLPYLLGKLKTPRVLERLEQTAAAAREEGWPYEQFLEVLLEAEVFARDASRRLRRGSDARIGPRLDHDRGGQRTLRTQKARRSGLLEHRGDRI